MDKSGRMQVEKFKSRYTCNICGNALATERNLKRHLEKLHFEVTCNVCGKVFLSRQELEYHKLSHRETPVERPTRQVQILDNDHVIFESHPDLEVPLTQSAEVFTSTLHLVKPEQDSLRPVKPVAKESQGERSTQPENEEDKFESVIVVAEPNLEIQGHQTIFLLADESEVPHDNQELQKAVREFMALQTDINLDGARIHFEINSQTTNSDQLSNDYVENQDVQIEAEELKKVSLEENSADQAIRELLSSWEPDSNIMDLATQGSLTNPVDTTVKNLINLTVNNVVKETLTEQIENFPEENRTSEAPLDLSIGNLSNDKMENSYTLSIPEDLANLSIIENSEVCVIRDNPEVTEQIILRADDGEAQFENQTVYHLYPEEGTIVEDEIKVESTDKNDNNEAISIPYHDPETFAQHPEQFSDLSHATLEKSGKQTPPVCVEYRPIVRKKFNEKPISESIKKASNKSKAFLTLKGDKNAKKMKSPTETRIKRRKPIKKLLIEKIKTDSPPKGKICCVCDQSFPTLKELHAHEDTHLTENIKYVYTCKVCRKSFETLSLLYSHMKKHPEEKPFQCPTCDKKCKQSSELYIHQMSHEKNKHFRCEYCRNSYSRPHNLSRHRFAIHNVNGECLISDSFTLKEWKEYTKRLRQKSARRFRSTVVIDDAGSNHPSYEKEDDLNDSDDGYTNTLDSEYVSDSSETDSWLNADLKDQTDLQKGKMDSYDELFTSSNVSEEDSRPSIDLSVESISSSEDPVKPHMQDLELIEKQEEELKKLDAELDVDLASLGISNAGSGNSSDQDQIEIVKKPAAKRINSVKCRKRYSPTSLMDILEESAKEIFVNISQGIDMTNTIPVNKPQTVVKKPKPKAQGPKYDSPLEDNDCLMEVLEQSARVIFKENVITPKNKKDSQFNEDQTGEKVDSKQQIHSKVVEKEDSPPQLAQISPLNSPRKDWDKYFGSNQQGSSRKMAQRPRRRVYNQDESSNSSSVEINLQAEPKSLKKVNKPITTKETKPRLSFSDWLDTLGADKPLTARKSFPSSVVSAPKISPKASTEKYIDNTNSITVAPDLDKFKHQEWVDVICGVGSQRAKKSFPRARLQNNNSISKKSNPDEVFNTVKKIASDRPLTVVQVDDSTSSVVKCNRATIKKDMYKEGPRTLQFGSSTITYYPSKEIIDKTEQLAKESAKITLGEKLIKNIVKPPCPTTEVNTPDMSIVVTSGLIEPSSTPNLIENIKSKSKRIQSVISPSLVKENPNEPKNTDLPTNASQNKGGTKLNVLPTSSQSGELISILNPKSKVASKTTKPLQAVVPTIKVNPKNIPEQTMIIKKFNSFGQEDAEVIKIRQPALKAKQTARKSFPSKSSLPTLNKLSSTKTSSKTFLDQYLSTITRNSVPQTSSQLELKSHSKKDTSVSESDKDFSDWNMDDIDTDSSDELDLHPETTSKILTTKNKTKNLNKKPISEGNELLEPSAIFNSPSTFIVQTPDMPLEENVPSISSQEDIVYRTLISSSTMDLNVGDGKTQSSVGSQDAPNPAISSKKSGSKIEFNSDKGRKPGSKTVEKFKASDSPSCENLPTADSSQNETSKTASIDSEPTLLLNSELMNIVNFLNPPKSPTETEPRQSPDKDKDSKKPSRNKAENLNRPQSKRIGPKTRNTTKIESSASSETPTTSGGMSKSTKSDGKTFSSTKSHRKSSTSTQSDEKHSTRTQSEEKHSKPTQSDRKHTSISTKSDEKSFKTTKLGEKQVLVSKTCRDSVESEKVRTPIATRRSGRLVKIENVTEGSSIGTVTPTTRAIKTAKGSRSKKLLSNSEIETALFNEEISPTSTDPTKKAKRTCDDIPTNLTSSEDKISYSKCEKQKSAESVLSEKSSKANPVRKTKTTKSATKTLLKSIEKTSEDMEKSIELGSVEKSLETTEPVEETVELSAKAVEPDQALDISMELAKTPRKSVESDQALHESEESAKEKVDDFIESSKALSKSIESSKALGESIESSKALGESIESSEALGESIESSEALSESIESSQNLSPSKESAETICEAIVSAEDLCESIESTEALHLSIESTEDQSESILTTETLEKSLEPVMASNELLKPENEYTNLALASDEYIQPPLANNESVTLSLAHTPSFEAEKFISDDIEPEDAIKYSEKISSNCIEPEKAIFDFIEANQNVEGSIETEKGLVDSSEPEKGLVDSIALEETIVDSIELEETVIDSIEPEKGLGVSIELEETVVDYIEPENDPDNSVEPEETLVYTIEPDKGSSDSLELEAEIVDFIEPEEGLADSFEQEKGIADSIEQEKGLADSIEQEKGLTDSIELGEALVDSIEPENYPEDSIEPEETIFDTIEPGKGLSHSIELEETVVDSMEPEESSTYSIEPEKGLADSIVLEETIDDSIEQEKRLADSIELGETLVNSIEPENDPEDSIKPEETLLDTIEPGKGLADSIELEETLDNSMEPEKDPEDFIEPEETLIDTNETEKSLADSIELEEALVDSIEPENDPKDSIEPEEIVFDTVEPGKGLADSIELQETLDESVEPEKDPEDFIEPEETLIDTKETEKGLSDSIELEEALIDSIDPEKDPEDFVEPEETLVDTIEPEKGLADSIELEEVLDNFIKPEELTNFTDPNKTKDYIDPLKVLVDSTELEKAPAEFIQPEETVSNAIQPEKDIVISLEKAPTDSISLEKASSNCTSLEKALTHCMSPEKTPIDCMMPEMSLEIPIRTERVNEDSMKIELDVTLKESATPVEPTAYDSSTEPVQVIEGISECSQPINKSIDVFDSLQQTEVDMCQNSTYPVRYVEPSKIDYSLEPEEDSSRSNQDTLKPDKSLEVSTKSLETLKPVETVNLLGSKEASESKNFSKIHHLSRELRDILEESQVYKSPSNEGFLYVSATGRCLRKSAQRKLSDSDIMAKAIKTEETGASSSKSGRRYVKKNLETEAKSSTSVSTNKEDKPLDSEKKSNSETRKGRRLSKKAFENQVETEETGDSSSKPRRKRGKPSSMKKNSEIELNSSNIVSRSDESENATMAAKRGVTKTKESNLQNVTVKKSQKTLESQVESTDVEKTSLHVEPSIVDTKTDIESAAKRVTKPKPLSKKTKDVVIKLQTESLSECSDNGASNLCVEPTRIHEELTSLQVETPATFKSGPKSKTNKPKPLSKKVKLESPEVEESSLSHEPTTFVTTKTTLESSTKPISNRPKPLSKKTKVTQHVSTSVEETDLQDKLPTHVTTEVTLLSSAKPITYRPKPLSKKTKERQLEYSNVEATLLTNVTTETTLLSSAKPKTNRPKPLSKKRSEVEAPNLEAISQNFIETNSSIINDPLTDTMSSEPGTSRTKPITRKTLNNRNTRGLGKKRPLTEESMEEIDVECGADFNSVHDYLDKRKTRKINSVNRTQAAVLKSKLKRSAKFVVHKGFTIVPLRPTFDLRPAKNRKLRTPENKFNVTDMRSTAQHFDSQEEKIRKPKSEILKKRGQSFQLVSSPRKKKKVDFTSSSQPDTSDSELLNASVNEFESASTTELLQTKTSPVKAKNKKSNKKIISTSTEHSYHTRRRRKNMPMPNLSPVDEKFTGIKKFAAALRLTSIKQLETNETTSSATFCEANINESSVPTTGNSESAVITKSDANKITVLIPISNKSSSVLGFSDKDTTTRLILTEFPTASSSCASVESDRTFTRSDENNLPVTPNANVTKSSKEKITQIQNLARKTFPFSSSLSLNESFPVLSPNLNLPSTASTSEDSPPVLSPGPSSPLISSFLNSSSVPKCVFNSTTTKSDIDHYDLKSVYMMVKDPLSKVHYQVPVESCLKSFNKLCVNLGNSILPSENIKPAYRNGRRVNN